MTDEWDSDCETALEDLTVEIANGDEARALKALLPIIREQLRKSFDAGYKLGALEAQAACESAKLDDAAGVYATTSAATQR